MTCRNSDFHINYNTPCLPPKNFAFALFSSSPGRIVNPKRNWKQWLCKTFGDKQGVLWECESSEVPVMVARYQDLATVLA